MKNINRKLFILAFFFLMVLTFLVVFGCWRTLSCSGQPQSEYMVDVAFPNLSFTQPVGIVAPGDGTNRLFVIEQAGVIRVFENSQAVAASSSFLDIRSRVLFGGEQGLLGLAFHPNYAVNGYFYVEYVADNPLRTVIARYSVSPNNLNQALSDSELVLLEVSQPFANHKGGQIAFGADRYLYVGLGDGGSGGDPSGNGQNRATLLGKILRIDVESPSQGRNYSIPPDNPYAGNTLGYKEEIYALGFRNPWRFSFDSITGRLWVADVGQSQREEIDIVEKGKNYGWNIMEGSLTFSSGSQAGLELPVWEYGRDEGISIIGGYVYLGSNLAGLYSRYVYGDYGSGKVWALQYSEVGMPVNILLVDTSLNISSFGVDERNELYFCALDGKIYVLTDNATPTSLPTATPTSAPTPTPTPAPTDSPTSTPTPNPSPSPTPHEPTTSPAGFMPPETFYAVAIIGVSSIIAITLYAFKKKRSKAQQ